MIKIKTTPNMPPNGGLMEDYTWVRLLKKEQNLNQTPLPALFLDRDGVVNVEKSFITSPDMLELEEGIVDLICFYNQKKYPVIIVTNQSGIAKQKMNWATYWRIEDRLIEMLAAEGAFIDLILACPCHPDGIAPYNEAHPPARKPAAGMIEAADHFFSIQKEKSVIIGDRRRDIEAGARGGLGLGFFRDSGHEDGKLEWDQIKPCQFTDLRLFKVRDVCQILPIIKGL